MGRNFRAGAALVSVVASGLVVSGCMSSPTYGTGRSSNAQLTTDISSMFSMKAGRGTAPDYKPRPELVKPASTVELPTPQESVNNTNNPAWPESPEQKRARLVAEISQNQDGNTAERLIVNDVSVARTQPGRGMMTPEQIQAEQARPMSNRESKMQREAYNKRLAEANSDPTQRKYLSEPPLDYRQPAATAAVGDIGEDEKVKAKRIKKQATKGGGWRDLVPWL